MDMLFAKIVTQNWGLVRYAEMLISMTCTPMAIRNLKVEEIIKRLQSPNSETAKKVASESIQIDAIVPKKPKQVAVRSNTNDIHEDGENMTNGCSTKVRCYWFCCFLGIALIAYVIFLIYVFAL